MSQIPVVHLDSDRRFVVVEKPPGLLSVPGIGPEKQDCLVARVRWMFPWATGPMVVHRLDMETSGLLVVALEPGAQSALSVQFHKRKVEKIYTALLDGLVHADEGEIRLPMRLDIDNRPYQIVDFAQGKDATTRFRVLAREVDRTRIEFRPITGRTHQLRVHASSKVNFGSPGGGLDCPIVGDSLYGRNPQGPGAPPFGLMLHASMLAFLDPKTGRRLEFESRPPF